ncbi:MAG: DUF4437 domain-containing protein [Planctomycetota bacterium]
MTRMSTSHAVSICVGLCAGMTLYLSSGCSSNETPDENVGTDDAATVGAVVGSPFEIVTISDAQWGALNPLRGNAGPRAADLWGDRTSTDATGFLVRFAEGFSSPPHIHNTTYRGIVIEGEVHNDDPQAEELWMPEGSYWTQPAGEVHITSAQGDGRVAYIEIQNGPYLVMPPEEATDNGERAINVHAANMIWLDASTTNRITMPADMQPADGPKLTFLWGDPQDDQASGAMVAVPAGLTCTIHSDDPSLGMVVIKGRVDIHQPDSADRVTVEPGAFIGSQGTTETRITMSAADTSWVYVRCVGAFELIAASDG